MGAQRCELPTWESIDLLKARSVGRVCIIEHGCPLAIPINYRVVDEGVGTHIVVVTAADTMLGRYEGPGSLEVDEVDLDTGSAWSLIVRGVLTREPDANALPDTHPLMTEGRHRWLRLRVTAISGRRFKVRTAADGLAVEWQLAR
jgi:Pyridoxamine 5'-phosphate oxidase